MKLITAKTARKRSIEKKLPPYKNPNEEKTLRAYCYKAVSNALNMAIDAKELRFRVIFASYKDGLASMMKLDRSEFKHHWPNEEANFRYALDNVMIDICNDLADKGYKTTVSQLKRDEGDEYNYNYVWNGCSLSVSFDQEYKSVKTLI